jgi:hypothetical protein
LNIQSKDHKDIVGSVDGKPFRVLFDEDGYAEVDEAVGEQLLQLQAALLVEPKISKENVEDKEPKILEEMHPMQLKKFAKDNGIEIGEASKKDELLPIINAFIEQKYKREEAKDRVLSGGTGDQQ